MHFVRRYIKTKKFQNFIKYLIQYFDNAMIHGLKYFAKTSLNLIEVIFWSGLLILSIYFSAIIGKTTWNRYQTSNTMVTIEKNYRDWNVSFPSITLCSKNKINEDKLNEYMRKYQIDTDLEQREFRKFIEMLAELSLKNLLKFDVNFASNVISPNDYAKVLFDIMIDLNSTSKTYVGELDVIRTISEIGICYTSNNLIVNELASRHWNDTKYFPDIKTIFKVNLFDPPPIENLITGYKSDIIFYLHSPYEIPVISDIEVYAKDRDVVEVYVLCSEVTVEDNFEKNSKISQRHCRFPVENNLKNFQYYSFHLCQQECRMALCYDLCGCIPYFYRQNANTKFKICGVVGMNCVYHNREILKTLRSDPENPDTTIECDCLPNCYESKLFMTRLSFSPVRSLNSGILIKMVEFPLVQYKRQIIFSFQDLLVSIGGILGLFLGSSILSFVELIYFFSFHLYLYFKK